MKYILYHKELYIVKDPLTKNRTCQSWRGNQIAMSDDIDALTKYANKYFRSDEYYIEQQPERSVT
jgi:hypothetical protein